MKKVVIVLLCALVLVGCQNSPQSNSSQYKAVGYSDLSNLNYNDKINKSSPEADEPFPGFKDETIIGPILNGTIPDTVESLFAFYGDIINSENGSITASKSLSASLNLAFRNEVMTMTDTETQKTGTVDVDYLDARISADTSEFLPAIGKIVSIVKKSKADLFKDMAPMSGVNGDLYLSSRFTADSEDALAQASMKLAFSEYINLHVRNLTVEEEAVEDNIKRTLSGTVTSDPIHVSLAGSQIYYWLIDSSSKKYYSYNIPWTISLDVAAINLDLDQLFGMLYPEEEVSESPDASADQETMFRNIFFGGTKGDIFNFTVSFYDENGDVAEELNLKNMDFFDFAFGGD